MAILKTILITLVVFFAFPGAMLYADEPAIRSFLDKNEIGVGEKVKIKVEMEWKQEEGSSIIVEKISPPSSILLKQINSKQLTSSRLGKNGVFAERVLEYTYIGKEKGTDDITPAVIEYTFSNNPENKRIIKAQPIPIKVISRAAGFGKMALKGVLSILSAVLVLGVLVVLIKRVIFARADKEKRVSTDTADLEKKFCEKLKELNKHKISGNPGAYYAGVEKSLLEYVKAKYNSDLTVKNMNKLPEELKKICAECRFMSEKVRFSGYKPEDIEHDRLIRGITKYMKSLIPGEPEEGLIETID
ncbi:MAG: hypothetical protein KAQ99_01845 [Candidatus Aureabacteria bacterium]|nr:hypothetical protein [Candidatus Auribacterota bacterium]